MFRTNADADDECRYSSELWKPLEEIEWKSYVEGCAVSGISENTFHDAILDKYLKSLSESCREFASLLHCFEVTKCNATLQKSRYQDVRRCHCILYSEVDTDASDRAHGVCGVANSKESIALPFEEMLDRNRKHFYFLPAIDFFYSLAEKRCEVKNILLQRSYATCFDMLKFVLRYHKSALPVFGTVDHWHHQSAVNFCQRFVAVCLCARNTEPQHIHRSAEVFTCKTAQGSHG